MKTTQTSLTTALRQLSSEHRRQIAQALGLLKSNGTRSSDAAWIAHTLLTRELAAERIAGYVMTAARHLNGTQLPLTQAGKVEEARAAHQTALNLRRVVQQLEAKFGFQVR